MKYLFFFALAVMGFTLSAQASSTSTSTSTFVSESASKDSYNFKLKVGRGQMDDVVSAYIKLAEITGISKIVGVSSYTTNEGAVVQLNTKKRTLRIYSNDDRPASITIAQGLADQVREELELAPAPAPPRY